MNDVTLLFCHIYTTKQFIIETGIECNVYNFISGIFVRKANIFLEVKVIRKKLRLNEHITKNNNQTNVPVPRLPR